MYGVIFPLAALVYCVAGISITTGPSSTTQEIGSRFVLKCEVAGKTDSDAVIWRLYNRTTGTSTSLILDTINKNPEQYEYESVGSHNMVVKKATYEDDGIFECEAGDSKSARVYIYDKPDSITLDWEHSVNKEGAVDANQEYKLKCTTKHSYPPATHRYYKDGVELSNATIIYTYNNDTDTGYGDVTSMLPFTPTKTDIEGAIQVKCEADLYNERNVMSVSFGVNSAHRAKTIGTAAALVMLLSFLVSRN